MTWILTIPLQNCLLVQSQTDKSKGQIGIPQYPSCNEYWIPDIYKECRQTKGMFNQVGTDVLHCRQLQNKEQGNTLEQRVDDVIRGWEQKTKVCKPQTLDVHEQTVWTNNESQDSPMSHGCNTNYRHMTSHNRTDDDDSTLTLNSNNSVSGESHGLSLYSYWVCGTEGQLS